MAERPPFAGGHTPKATHEKPETHPIAPIARVDDARVVRRYIAVIQDPRGYPGPMARRDPAPPVGPSQPEVVSVVKADDFEALEQRFLGVVRGLRQTATDLGAAETAFRKLDEGTGYEPHVAQRDAERARNKALAMLREYAGEND